MEVRVPSSDAPLIELWEFALTYHGYERHGDVQGLGELANGARDRWEADGLLPHCLDEVRGCLFFEQRRWRHLGGTPTGRDEHYIRALLERIRELSGGTVPVRRSHP